MSAARHRLEHQLAIAWPPDLWQEVTILVAVSGGADSVASLRALWRLKTGGAGRLLVAHFNHHLRGVDSEGDECFVRQLCGELGVPCEVGGAHVARLAAAGGDGLEAAARHARYEFLRQSAERLGARYIVTGHTADDQAETILHRILRGTGLAGLAGIPRARALGPATTLIRPLLTVTRADVLAYLDVLGQPFREDRSNLDLQLTRNRIRHELLPTLRNDYNANVSEALVRLGRLAGEAQEVIDRLVSELVERAVSSRGNTRVITAASMQEEPAYLVRELLIRIWREQSWPQQEMGLTQWNLLAEMLQTESAAKQTLPGNILAERQGGELVLWRGE